MKPTCTLDSGKFILRATSSLMKMSGYLVFWKRASNTSSWALVKVVLSRLCFRGLPAEKTRQQKMTFQLFDMVGCLLWDS